MNAPSAQAPIFVVGATGYVGQALIAALAGSGRPAIAHIRPDSPRLVEWREHFTALGPSVLCDDTPFEPEALAARLKALTPAAVILVHGTTRARMKALGRESAKASYEAVDYGLTAVLCRSVNMSGLPIRLVYLSAIGANAASANPYLRARGKAEEAVKSCGTPYAILRPAMISGEDRQEKRLGERLGAQLFDLSLGAAACLGLSSLKRAYATINSTDLAALLIQLADGQKEGTLTLDQLRST